MFQRSPDEIFMIRQSKLIGWDDICADEASQVGQLMALKIEQPKNSR